MNMHFGIDCEFIYFFWGGCSCFRKQFFFEGEKLPLFGFSPKAAIMMKHQEYSLSYPDGNASDFDSIKYKEKTVLLERRARVEEWQHKNIKAESTNLVLVFLILPATLKDRHYYYDHCTDQETETWGE